ncbi:MAG: phytanoyl-CoA dioxygenase family protein [Candidatus Hydrogenedentes bacterium]|nr:phytanoyl-CoA dioxygenase family protein [Candidatus Hydrogenedentota bacterium]
MDAKELQFYRDNSFLIVRGAVRGSALENLTEELDELRRNVETGRWRGNHLFERVGVARVIFGPYDYCPSFRELVNREDIVTRARGFLGGAIQLHHTKLMCKAASVGTAQPPHQDYYYWQGRKANQVAVILCIDPATEANGCLRAIPGSHKQGLLEHHEEYHAQSGERHWVCRVTEQDRAREVAFVAEPGDAMFFGSLTIHYSGANDSGCSRRAVIWEYDELGNLAPAPGWGAPLPPVEWT